jgi:hypothetical protein
MSERELQDIGIGRPEMIHEIKKPFWLERFQAKWMPVRVKKTRQTKRQSSVPIPSQRKRF